MHMRTVALLGLLVAVACTGGERPNATADTGLVQPLAPADSASALVVTLRGIGRLEAGMTMAEAAAVLTGGLEVADEPPLEECTYAVWRNGPDGVSIMIDSGRVARVDVSAAGVRTTEGAGIGDTEEQIQRLYPGRVTVTPHKYEAGNYLTIIDVTDSSFALVFETSAGNVTRYRSGRRPHVEYVEGCA